MWAFEISNSINQLAFPICLFDDVEQKLCITVQLFPPPALPDHPSHPIPGDKL